MVFLYLMALAYLLRHLRNEVPSLLSHAREPQDVSARFLERFYPIQQYDNGTRVVDGRLCDIAVTKIAAVHEPHGGESNGSDQPRHPTLELYHSVRDAKDINDTRIQSILTKGFKPGWYGNKGPGVYLSSHSRYAMRWSGSPVVLVCHVDASLPPDRLRRYRSELRSGQTEHNGWEYVVTDGKDVRVSHVLNYHLRWHNSSHKDVVCWPSPWVEHGESGCRSCDERRKRCDCALLPNAHNEDIVLL